MSARDIIEALKREARLAVPVLFATLFVALPASAQPPLSLSEAIARARARNPDAGSAAAAEREAAERVTQARGGYFPKVDVAESWQRGNDPVFVFSSHLAQRQFTAADFAPISRLMHSIIPMPPTTSARRSPSSSRCSIAPRRRMSEPRRSGGTWRPPASGSSTMT
jgi:uncharacterized protein with von Willebrand factor type A (vWA) domain